MGRGPCCAEKVALKKGLWATDEDQKLLAYIQKHGHGSWRALPEKAGLARCMKSCRLRWTNYLRPDIKRGRFSYEEDQMIIQMHAILGNRWSAIASQLPRRTDNDVKNYWNTHLQKRLRQIGIDPVTHQTSRGGGGLGLSPARTPLVSTQLTHTMQWHCALAEAEGRLSRSSAPNPVTLRADHQLIHVGNVAPQMSESLFMRSWKSRVEDTLRPTFGALKLERPPERNLNKSQIKARQDWNVALGITQTSTSTNSSSQFPEKYSANMVTLNSNEFDPSQSLRNVSASDQLLQETLLPYYSSLPMTDVTTFTNSMIRNAGAVHFASDELGVDSSPLLEKNSTNNMVQMTSNEFDRSQSLRNSASDQLQSTLIPDFSLRVMDMTTFKDSEIRGGGAFHFATDELGSKSDYHFSPTSNLQGPDSNSCSGSDGDSYCKFEFDPARQGGSYHRFPLIDAQYGEHADSASVSCDIPESFWQAPPGLPAADSDHQETNLLEDLKSLDDGESVLHEGGEDRQELEHLIEVTLPLRFGASNNGASSWAAVSSSTEA